MFFLFAHIFLYNLCHHILFQNIGQKQNQCILFFFYQLYILSQCNMEVYKLLLLVLIIYIFTFSSVLILSLYLFALYRIQTEYNIHDSRILF